MFDGQARSHYFHYSRVRVRLLPRAASLWSVIQNALNDSEYFILLASPEAASSRWVSMELEYWCEKKEPNHILIVLTGGTIAWDDRSNDFDWDKTTALPTSFSRRFSQEPLWVDLSWATQPEQLSLRHLSFRDSVATLAATLYSRPKDELDGEDVR